MSTKLSFWFAPGSEGLWPTKFGIGAGEQGINLYPERFSQAVKHVDSGVRHATLDPTEVRGGHAGIHSQHLLRQTTFAAQAAQVPR